MPLKFPKLCILLVIGGSLAPAAFGQADLVIPTAVSPAPPAIPAHTFQLKDFGAVGDGRTLNTSAFEKAVTAVGQAGGGTLVVPAGVFVTGPFALCSQLNLHLEPGAVIKAPETFAELGLPDPALFHSQSEAEAGFPRTLPLLHGEGLHDVALTGPGTIDGSGRHWWVWSERASRNAATQHVSRVWIHRPNLVFIDGCDRLEVSGVTFLNSSRFNLVVSHVHDLNIGGVKVRAPWDTSAPNTDGIDIGPGNNFWVHDCDLDTGDDDIAIKSGGTNIVLENLAIHHGHGLSIGSETVAGVNGMLVRHVAFDHTDNGIRLKSMRGNGGLVENVRYTDITMTDVATAVIFQLDYVDDNVPNFRGDPRKLPVFRNVLIDHLAVTGSRDSCVIHGLPESRITGVTLRDASFEADRDFDVKDADDPILDRVTKSIRK